MRCGSHVASNGNAIRITSRTRSVATNGITPLKIVANDTSLTTLLITKTLIPTGGWIRPSSTVITMMTPKPPDRIEAEMGDHGKDDRHRQDDHRHRVHQAAQHEIHHHDEREHTVPAHTQT